MNASTSHVFSSPTGLCWAQVVLRARSKFIKSLFSQRVVTVILFVLLVSRVRKNLPDAEGSCRRLPGGNSRYDSRREWGPSADPGRTSGSTGTTRGVAQDTPRGR